MKELKVFIKKDEVNFLLRQVTEGKIHIYKTGAKNNYQIIPWFVILAPEGSRGEDILYEIEFTCEERAPKPNKFTLKGKRVLELLNFLSNYVEQQDNKEDLGIKNIHEIQRKLLLCVELYKTYENKDLYSPEELIELRLNLAEQINELDAFSRGTGRAAKPLNMEVV